MPDAGGQRARPAPVPDAQRRPRADRLRGDPAADLAALEEGVAAAAAPATAVLVSVFLAGGIDSLSVLAPVGDPNYRKLRPKLALGESDGTPFAEDGRLRWHPSAAGLATLHGEGKVTRDAGRRLRPPGPVALQLAPLLGGRRARPPAA